MHKTVVQNETAKIYDSATLHFECMVNFLIKYLDIFYIRSKTVYEIIFKIKLFPMSTVFEVSGIDRKYIVVLKETRFLVTLVRFIYSDEALYAGAFISIRFV